MIFIGFSLFFNKNPPRRPKTPPRRPKTPPRRLQDAFFFSFCFQMVFWSILGRFSMPTWFNLASKIYQNPWKINPKFTKISSWAPRGPKTPPRPFQARKQGAISPPHRAPFWKDFGTMLAPRATKRPVKKHTKFSLIWKSIYHRFSLILPGFWEDLGPKLASKIN